ncbi:anti-sigma factor [Synechococcus sp. ATX 2A4]|uniref:anti-sigma factor domain-containing protein n=1 Tax=Synechococcus sp. ATX 2A4 TaxID=2823727 RepID=UPI0020CB9D38|nr:anti-sigma factor [Synechococcus sp. ATX 2A4]MCP9886222.1 anti-sigma factor [Synechococcus sp. ATX 2A4]
MSSDHPLNQRYGADQPFDVDVLLAGHALGDLDETERSQLAELLRQQPALRQRLDQFSTTLELLPLALPVTSAPPSALRQRLLARPATPRLPGLLAAALGLGLLAVGVQLHRTQTQLAQLQQQLATSGAPLSAVSRQMPLRAMAGASATSGAVIVTGNPSHNMLLVEGLPPPPPEHTYRLWAKVNGRLVGCVPFVPDAKGHVAMPIPTSPTSQASSVSVSVEPLGGYGARPAGRQVLGDTI